MVEPNTKPILAPNSLGYPNAWETHRTPMQYMYHRQWFHGVSYPMRQVRWADLNLRAKRHASWSGWWLWCQVQSGLLDRGFRLRCCDGEVWRHFRTLGIRGGVLMSGQPGENWCWAVSCRSFTDKPLSPQLAPTSGQIIPPDQRWPENWRISRAYLWWVRDDP